MIADEEFQARMKAWADANTITFAEMGENIRKLGEKLAEGIMTAAAALEINKEGQNGAQGE
jgi:hypothetical protein